MSNDFFFFRNLLNKPQYKPASTGPYPLPLALGAGVAAGSVQITSNATVWTYGNWIQIVAASPAAVYLEGIMMQAPTGGFDGQLQIAVGAAAAEVVIATVPMMNNGVTGPALYVPMPRLIPVANGVRLSGRSITNAASPNNYILVKLLVSNQSEAQ